MRPGVLVLQHYKENLRKCSLRVQRSRADFEFRTIEPVYPNRGLIIDGGVVLTLDAPVLNSDDRALFDARPENRLIVIDGTWTKIRSMVKNIVAKKDASTVDYRSLPDSLVTAYPRRSKLYDDPEGGLSTLEALVAAYHLLGYPALDLLEEYRWKNEFLERNHDFFRQENR